jgi:monoamine oxidase
LGRRVVAVEEEGNGIEVRLANGRLVRGRRAVLALPLPLQRELRFRPPLPEHRRRALAEACYGRAVKAALLFAEAGWRGAVGLPLVSEGGVVYEPEPAQPLLALFAGSRAARGLASLEPGRRTAVLLARLQDALGTRLPPAQAAVLVAWHRQRFSRGSYLILGPGQLTSWGGRLAERHGRLHFAGAEASSLPSYMEGAIRAAERAAEEVLATL